MKFLFFFAKSERLHVVQEYGRHKNLENFLLQLNEVISTVKASSFGHKGKFGPLLARFVQLLCVNYVVGTWNGHNQAYTSSISAHQLGCDNLVKVIMRQLEVHHDKNFSEKFIEQHISLYVWSNLECFLVNNAFIIFAMYSCVSQQFLDCCPKPRPWLSVTMRERARGPTRYSIRPGNNAGRDCLLFASACYAISPRRVILDYNFLILDSNSCFRVAQSLITDVRKKFLVQVLVMVGIYGAFTLKKCM